MSSTDTLALDKVTATIVSEMESVGLFHYNKLTFLFEYFFIKNFGTRYTKEKFVKLPHGPVIPGYHKQIESLHHRGIVNVDTVLLKATRTLSDDFSGRVVISRTNETARFIVTSHSILALIRQIVGKYGELPVNELERIVYATPPMEKFMAATKLGAKKPIGGYVLESDCVRMGDYKNPITEGRLLALRHAEKHPYIKSDQQKKIAEELAPLTNLR